MFGDISAIIPGLIRAIISLFIIVDPFGNIPIFISLTENMNKGQMKKVFNIATLIGVILLLAFAFAGQQIFNYFAISLQSFMIAGGILLLIIAVRILIVGGWEERAVSPESVGAVPIAVPLLVGPGAITTTIFNLQTFGIIVTIISVLIVFVIVWLILRFIEPIYSVLGKTGSLVIARVMALLIAAIAIQYILEGVKIFLEV
ncbi:MAG: MarC family protein [Candidatus Bathyarchaeia archaeon]